MASGMQEKQYTPSLLNFFIYNPTFGPREGEVSRTPRGYFIPESVLLLMSNCISFLRKRRRFCFTTHLMLRRTRRFGMWAFVKQLYSSPGTTHGAWRCLFKPKLKQDMLHLLKYKVSSWFCVYFLLQSLLLPFRTFCPTKPAKSLHTQKNRQFFFEPEDNFWIVMVS